MPEYNNITPELKAELESIVGAEYVSSKQEDLDKHAVDESPFGAPGPAVAGEGHTSRHLQKELLGPDPDGQVQLRPFIDVNGLTGLGLLQGVDESVDGLDLVVTVGNDSSITFTPAHRA